MVVFRRVQLHPSPGLHRIGCTYNISVHSIFGLWYLDSSIPGKTTRSMSSPTVRALVWHASWRIGWLWRSAHLHCKKWMRVSPYLPSVTVYLHQDRNWTHRDVKWLSNDDLQAGVQTGGACALVVKLISASDTNRVRSRMRWSNRTRKLSLHLRKKIHWWIILVRLLVFLILFLRSKTLSAEWVFNPFSCGICSDRPSVASRCSCCHDRCVTPSGGWCTFYVSEVFLWSRTRHLPATWRLMSLSLVCWPRWLPCCHLLEHSKKTSCRWSCNIHGELLLGLWVQWRRHPGWLAKLFKLVSLVSVLRLKL